MFLQNYVRFFKKSFCCFKTYQTLMYFYPCIFLSKDFKELGGKIYFSFLPNQRKNQLGQEHIPDN